MGVRCSEENIRAYKNAVSRDSEDVCGPWTQNFGCIADQGGRTPFIQTSTPLINAASDGITARQRADVVNNMVARAYDLRLSNDVLFLAVACLDRYLAAVPTPLVFLQPLSVTCLWIASKYDSALAPTAAVFASLVRDPIGSESISAVDSGRLLVLYEATLLDTLNYRLAGVDTTKHHLRLIMQKLQASTGYPGALASEQLLQEQLYSMMSYLVEVGLLEYQLLSTPSSQLAAAAYALAHVLLGRHLDIKLLIEITGHSFPDLQTPLQLLCALHTTLVQALVDGKPWAVSVKYSARALHAVAGVAPLCDTRDPRLAL